MAEKVRDYAKLAKDIRDAIGESNITGATHCATRLRLVLKQSPSEEVTKKISSMPAVIQVVEKGGQYQIVIGTHAKDVYAELAKIITIDENAAGGGNEGIVGKVIATMSGCIAPFVYVLAAAGLIQGVLIVIRLFYPAISASGVGQIYDFISWTPFTYLPVLIAIAGSRHFKCNTFIAAWCALALVNNSWADMANRISAGETIKFLFIPLAETTFTSTVLPPLIMVGVLSIVEHWVEKKLPDVLKAIGTPFICTAIMVPATILVIGPISAFVSNLIAAGYNTLYAVVPWLASGLVGALWQCLVIFGVHWGMTPVSMANYNVYGYDVIQACCQIAVCAQAAACFGVFLKSKSKSVKNVAASASLTGLFGITEPAIYGVTLRFKKPFICGCISAAVGCIISSFFKSRYFVYAGLSGFLTIVNGIDQNNVAAYPTAGYTGGQFPSSFIGILIGTVVACVLAVILVQIVGFDDPKDVPEKDEAPAPAPAASISASAAAGSKEVTICAPLNGEIKKLEEVEDPTFAEGILGQGIAIVPSEGKLYSPVDGTVSMVFDTKHAISLETADGVEMLMHIGLETVNLGGKFFTAKVKDGDKVKVGDVLIEFNLDEIKKTYKTVTPVLVTNADDFSAIEPVKTGGKVKAGDPVIKVKA